LIPFDRRSFFRYSALGLLAAGIPRTAEAGTFFWKRLFSVPPRDTTFITPNGQFYLVQYAGIPSVEVSGWVLPVTGSVDRPLHLNYADFLSRPSVESMVTLECIDTLPGGGSIGNAVWRGIPLRTFLEEAGVDPDARDVVFRAADGYSDSIPLERVMEGDVLLVHSMNGSALPQEHGYPLRVIAPGLYGIKNVKWLTRIEVSDYNYEGYWQQRGWTDDGTIKTTSRIDQPGHYQEIRGEETVLKGVAFAGRRGVRRVLVSADGGRTWNEARIAESGPKTAWVLWDYPWRRPKPGSYTFVVKAVDGDGLEQTAEIKRAYPDGASGLHTIVAWFD
jgi:DMSO/TMAO reductase YedYZ molybdopterin-dependent catalytic subunit